MFLIMLQVTGHAGGVPIASPRGRSVEVPFEREQAFRSGKTTKQNAHKRVLALDIQSPMNTALVLMRKTNI